MVSWSFQSLQERQFSLSKRSRLFLKVAELIPFTFIPLVFSCDLVTQRDFERIKCEEVEIVKVDSFSSNFKNIDSSAWGVNEPEKVPHSTADVKRLVLLGDEFFRENLLTRAMESYQEAESIGLEIGADREVIFCDLSQSILLLQIKDSQKLSLLNGFHFTEATLDKKISKSLYRSMFRTLDYGMQKEYLHFYFLNGKFNFLNGRYAEANNCFNQVLSSHSWLEAQFSSSKLLFYSIECKSILGLDQEEQELKELADSLKIVYRLHIS